MSEHSSGAATKMAKTQGVTSTDLQDGPKLRTTLLISENLDRLVEVCAALEGKQKSEVVNEALATFLAGKDFIHSLASR